MTENVEFDKEQRAEINEKQRTKMNESKRAEMNEGQEADAREEQTENNLNELPLETILAQTEYCIEQLENPQISLEDAFRYYEDGIRKLKACNEKVEQIEQKMLVINSQGRLEDF